MAWFMIKFEISICYFFKSVIDGGNNMNFTENYSQLAMAVSHFSSPNGIRRARATDAMDIARAFILSVLFLYGFEGFGAWTLVSFRSRNIALEIFNNKKIHHPAGFGFM